MKKSDDTYLGSPDNPGTSAVVGYATIIGWLIAYFALYRNNKTVFSAFHLRQALLLHIISVIIYILAVLSLLQRLPVIIVTLLAVIFIVLWVKGVINAVYNQQILLPIIGRLSQKLFTQL